MFRKEEKWWKSCVKDVRKVVEITRQDTWGEIRVYCRWITPLLHQFLSEKYQYKRMCPSCADLLNDSSSTPASPFQGTAASTPTRRKVDKDICSDWRLSDWLVGRLIIWLIDWMVQWLIDWSIYDWLIIDCLFILISIYPYCNWFNNRFGRGL